MLRLILAVTAVALPITAVAQTGSTPAPTAAQAASAKQAESGQPPRRIRDISLSAGQTCPKQTAADEIVVCHRIEEPYRIPRSLRDDHPVAARDQSFVNRAATMDAVGREAAGLPDTCSPVGNGGQTGCAQQAARQWSAEKRAKASERQTP